MSALPIGWSLLAAGANAMAGSPRKRVQLPVRRVFGDVIASSDSKMRRKSSNAGGDARRHPRLAGTGKPPAPMPAAPIVAADGMDWSEQSMEVAIVIEMSNWLHEERLTA